ncbi:response regulator [Phycisphaerales bacterium AB-hyl4]|uniref:Response regulator n=1 Tax=Natronomicrosphaera hydrolytica TaxID=3242702 RepID=A0ABV4U6T5_9BACT
MMSQPSDRLDAPSADQPAPDAQEQAFDLSESSILIVDDNEQNVELLQAYLETLPCHITTASDGIEALQYIEDPDKPTPDLVLLDVMMPRMSGFEVCRKLKEDPATRTIPIMMVTALNELGDIERGVESGTDDFVSKPVNKLELITRVKSLLRVRHLKRELDRTEAYIRDIESRRDRPAK